MGLADRDYHQRPPNLRGGGFLSHLPPVVKWLLIINIGIFLLDHLVLQLTLGTWLHPIFKLPRLAYGFCFTIDRSIHGLQIWEFITFQFMHAGLLHVAFNSIGLYFFGPWMERWWGSKKFLIFYLLCGAAGAGFYTLLSSTGILADAYGLASVTPLIGASAGIFGILIGVAVIAPNMRVQLIFPPIELTMRQLAIGILIIASMKVFFNMQNAGGEAGHLGGAILGYILMRYPKLIGSGLQVSIHPPKAFQNQPESKIKPRTRVQLSDDSEVDAILDKISTEGFQSLTEEEKNILRKAAEKNNQ